MNNQLSTNQKKLTEKEMELTYGPSIVRYLWSLLLIRLPNGLCPRCKYPVTKYYKKLKKERAFICSRCLLHVYPQAGSFLEYSKIEIDDWYKIVYRMLSNRSGISAHLIHRTFGYSYPTAFRALHLIRKAMGECLVFDLQNSVLEIDGSFITTGNKSLGKHYRFKRGRGSEKHTTVLAIVERKGVCKMFPIHAEDADNVIPIILKNVPKSNTIYTDSLGAYNKLRELGFEHAAVNHQIEFVNGSASTNSAEGVFNNLKHTMSTFRNVSEEKLPNYLLEESYRVSFRTEHDYGMRRLFESLPSLELKYGSKAA